MSLEGREKMEGEDDGGREGDDGGREGRKEGGRG